MLSVLHLFCVLVWVNYAHGTCNKEELISVEQIHLSLVNELNVCVMWNSTKEMEHPVVWYFKGECTSIKEWIYSTGTQRDYSSSYKGFIYVANLADLESDSSYCYVIGNTCEETLHNQFKTPSSKHAMFAALSDAGTWGNVSYVMKNLAADSDVTMVLHPGDLSYGLTDDAWDTFGKIVEPVAREKPYMIIPGNWDVKNNFTMHAFGNRYTMPLVVPPTRSLASSYYYSFNYSVFHIVMMSSYDAYNSTSAQYKWAQEDLELANGDRAKHPWIVVCFHSPMYSSNAGHGGGDTTFRLAMERLLAKHQVDVVLTGHDHGYERSFPVIDNVVYSSNIAMYQDPNAPIHILVGTAGATLDEWLDLPAWSAHREASFGYTTLYASHRELRVVYIRQDLSIGDQFIIEKGKRLNLRMILMVGLVIVFAVLPLVLYKGLPTSLRNFLLCHHDSDIISVAEESIRGRGGYKGV